MLMARLLNRSASLLLLLLGVLSLAALLIQTFSFRVDPRFLLWLAAICLCQWFGAFSGKRFFAGLIISVLLLYLFAQLYSADLLLELQDALSRLREVYVRYLVGEVAPLPEAGRDHSALLLLFFFFLTAYLSLSLHGARGRITFTLLGYLPFFLACIAVNGEPEIGAIFGVCLFLILLLAGGSSYDDSSGRGGMLWGLLLPAALVLALCVHLADPSHYSFDEADIERSRRFDQLSLRLSELIQQPAAQTRVSAAPRKETPRLPSISGGNWTVRSGALDLRTDRRGVDETRVILYVAADSSERLYLRRLSYGDYTGSSWLPAEDGPELSSLSFAAEAASGAAEERSLTVSLLRGSDTMLLPYYSALSSNSDAYVPSDGEREYQTSYLSIGSEIESLRLSGEAAQRESRYRDYAHSRYTALPEATALAAEAILRDEDLRADDPELISKIASLVRRSGDYDISTPPYPREDTAIYFLTQSHRGYCIHFASAAAVLYRAAGIPARVTDGFVVSARAGERVEVRQADEHAWVEVYIDGLGWVPVEVTGSAGFDLAPEPLLPSSEIPEHAQPTPAQASGPPDISLAPQLPTDAPPSIRGRDEAAPKTDNSETPPESNQPLRLSPWLWLLLLPALLFFLRELDLLRRKSALRQKDRSKAALALWREARALCAEDDIPDAIRSCAERAAFGRTPPGTEELRSARQALKRLETDTAQSARRTRRLLLRLRGRLYR